MTQWRIARALGSAPDLSLLGPVPLELDPSWLSSRVNGVDKYVQYFLLGDEYRPCGYAPFFVHQSALAYCLGETTIFHIPVLRYTIQGGPLCENQALLAGLFKPLSETIGRRGVVFFEGVRLGSPLAELLTSPDSAVFDLFHVVPYGPAYTRRLVELPAGAQFEDYLRTLGSKTREDVRRTRKNFSVKAGETVTLVRYTEPQQADELAAALAQVSRKTYQYHLLGLGLENTPAHVAHLRATAAGGWLRAYVLWIGKSPIAFGVGYYDGHTYHGHSVGYDPDISKLQPGIYLHTEVMADLLADGIRRFDFLPGDSLYKQRMSNNSREERHYYLIPRGWPGTVYAHTLVAVNLLSETIGRLLDKTGLKERIKRMVRVAAVKRSAGEN
ncbi:GNAT family N-acetyltransferase [Nitrosovibrio tenuis]|uniref:Acetyltransferase involved in cellulose biosynthesis, CelD/BcsL family n=1 Tax=Nitrosovibrio tenuis TaxID=1233 RepID=A0A1H7FXX6_9PROT|nr:GNAT family N-acetyltransferase [Nitrosovibrio tenuis]SEK30751.1 Acetyltransferase involved in cellulose biosynthesis, CelD/BcsL family [Nitrosovibrio tenuis]